jgi:glycosyltransferase involved in cell wall biosynthesis
MNAWNGTFDGELLRMKAANTNSSHRPKNRIFLKWFPYDKRNDAIGKAIDAKCYYVYYGRSGSLWSSLWRFPLQFLKTLYILGTRRPDFTLVTNPPIFAVLAVGMFASLTRTRFIIDSHTAAFHAKWQRFDILHRILARRAARVMVTNEFHAQRYASWGAKPFIFSDVLLDDLPSMAALDLKRAFTLVVVCSFADDEPLSEILAGAAMVPHIQIFITGSTRGTDPALLSNAPANVKFTGFISDPEFFALLARSHCVMTLTTRDNTMQNAAYEALSLRKPMILSDWPVLRSVYKSAAIYVDNTAHSIGHAIKAMSSELTRYQNATEVIYEERKRAYDRGISQLLEIIDQ